MSERMPLLTRFREEDYFDVCNKIQRFIQYFSFLCVIKRGYYSIFITFFCVCVLCMCISPAKFLFRFNNQGTWEPPRVSLWSGVGLPTNWLTLTLFAFLCLNYIVSSAWGKRKSWGCFLVVHDLRYVFSGIPFKAFGKVSIADFRI